jgi:hypothetical protein
MLLHRSWAAYANAGLATRVRCIVCSALVVVITAIPPLLIARLLMSWGLWINPGPMLAGLFFDSWHASVGERAIPGKTAADQVLSALFSVVWIVVVGMALYLAARELVAGAH